MNLLKAGPSLVCYDINREAVKDIVSMGAEEGNHWLIRLKRAILS